MRQLTYFDYAAESKELHRLNPIVAKISNGEEVSNWKEKAELPLYRFKRAQLLAELLLVRLSFQKNGFHKASKKSLKSRALQVADFQKKCYAPYPKV